MPISLCQRIDDFLGSLHSFLLRLPSPASRLLLFLIVCTSNTAIIRLTTPDFFERPGRPGVDSNVCQRYKRQQPGCRSHRFAHCPELPSGAGKREAAPSGSSYAIADRMMVSAAWLSCWKGFAGLNLAVRGSSTSIKQPRPSCFQFRSSGFASQPFGWFAIIDHTAKVNI